MNNIPKDPFVFEPVPDTEFNLTSLFYKYLAYWKWFALSLVLAVVLAFFYLKTQPPLYDIQGSILIKDDSKGLDQGDMLKQLDIFSGTKVVDNEIEVLKSYTLMKKAVSSLNLQVSYFTAGNFRDTELYGETCPVRLTLFKPGALSYKEPFTIEIRDKSQVALNGEIIPVNRKINTLYGTLRVELTGYNPEVNEVKVRLFPVSDVTENYMSLLKVEPSSKMSSVLLMSFESTVPQKGKDLLNKLIEEYNTAGLEDKNRVAYNTLAFIDKRLKLVSSDLKEVEKEVESYKSREGITDISAESKLFLESVQQNDLQLNQVKIQEGILENIRQYVSSKKNEGTTPATLGVSDPTLLALIGRLSELQGQREQNIKLMKADNPIIISLDKQIITIKENIRDNIKTLQESLAITRRKLEKQNALKESLIKTIPGKERTLVDITRQQAIKNDIYVFLLQKREETALSYASAVSDSRTIDEARSSSQPFKPVKRNIYLAFGLLGLFLPVGIIYIIDLLNNKIKSRKDIERFTRIPVLADIAYSEHEDAIVINGASRSILAEQIRALRTNLSFLAPGKGIQSLLFTSSMSGEGKSFVSLNLGASLAMIGKKTVILELDMRKPKLHSALKMANVKGVSNFLIGSAQLDEVIQEIPGQENYYIITCGSIPPNPVELLINGRLGELFEQLRERFDQIIIDAPPVGIVTDAQVLEQYADATIFLVRHDFTPRDRLKLADSLFREKRFKNLNLVFNAIKEGGKYGYGYGGYSYGYGYGYGYYQ
ncbi:polysaccharide biosynthesis tyrosine autokinase [Pedobacter sp. BS3]|uniref:GumC family protein n=1 Tax=Pedobacter sp. BS3 TaxID=2567937 RepID=UPI0011EC1B78|nr:tyrosine-protein kinase [Pedobacter sp. BS3]TZF84457.1 polysaccharide biosynthesis tyrosine autokinase [Pedobacter sp. BS3]